MTDIVSGKSRLTYASHTFVREAELFIVYNTDEVDRAALRNAIKKVKSGELVFKAHKAPLQYLIDQGVGV